MSQVATVDLIEPSSGSNPAREFYKDLMRTNLLDLGIKGWMADFGEYTPTEARSQYANPWWGEQDQEEILHQVYSQVSIRLSLMAVVAPVAAAVVVVGNGAVVSFVNCCYCSLIFFNGHRNLVIDFF